MVNEPEVVDIDPKYWNKIKESIRKDWHLYALCLATIIICWSYYTDAQESLDEAMEKCNDFWVEQVEKKCPTFFAIHNTPKFNLTLGVIDNGELTTN